MKTPLFALAAACCLLPAHRAAADLYAYDGFDYGANTANNETLIGKDPSLNSAGSSNLAGATAPGGGAGPGGSNIFQTTGLSMPPLVTRGGGGRYKNAAGAAAFMGYGYSGPTLAPGSTLYTSHLVRLEMEKTANSVISLRFNTSKTASSGTSYFVAYSDISNATSPVATQYGGTTAAGTGSLQFNATTPITYVVIGRFTNIGMTSGTRTATTYVLNQAQFANYADGGFGEAEWDAAAIGEGADQIVGRATQNHTTSTAYNLTNNGGIQFGIGNAGSPGQDVSYDELRCGSTLADVLPHDPVIPTDPVLVSLNLITETATEPGHPSPSVGRLQLFRMNATTQAVTVNLDIAGTATNGVDYQLPSQVTLPANTNSVFIDVTPLADSIVEPDETVAVTLVAGESYNVDVENFAGTIIIKDGPAPATSKLVQNLAAGIPQKVVVYGTSLTAGNLWPPQLKAALDAAFPSNPVTMVNSGGSGENSVWGVANLTSKVINQNPNTVFIEFSVNDAVYKDVGFSNINPAQARANLVSMINSIKTALPNCEIILQVMSPVIGDRASYRQTLVQCQQNYRDVAKEKGLLCIDHMSAWQPLVDQSDATYYAITLDGDGLHPLVNGYSQYMTPVLLREIGAPNNLASGAVMLHATNQRTAEPYNTGGTARSTKFKVTRGGSTASELTVPITIGGTATNGTDYPAISTSVTIPVGSSSVSFDLTPSVDAMVEGEEKITVALVAGAGYTLATPNKASLILEDRPFDNWRKAKFTPSDLTNPLISGDNADPDNDGIRNLIEFYTNRDPKTFNANPVTLGSETSSGQKYLTLTYDRVPNNGLTGLPQTSGDLSGGGWHSGSTYFQETILSDTGLIQSVKARSLAPIGAATKEFIRLNVTNDP